MRDYLLYYHEDRIHEALNKVTPRGRLIKRRETDDDTVMVMPRVGGLHSMIGLCGGRPPEPAWRAGGLTFTSCFLVQAYGSVAL